MDTTYILILFIILLSGILKKYIFKLGKFEINLSFFIPCAVLFAFAALRSVTVGADTRQYQIVFQLCSGEKWSLLHASKAHYSWVRLDDNEIGYKIFNKLISYIGANPQIITAANSLLLIFFVKMVIEKFSEDKWLSIFLFYTFAFYQTALNLTPSSIVSYYMFLLIPLIKNKKILGFAAASALGISFHVSAIFFLPVYFLNKIKLNGRRIFLIIIGGILAIVLYNSIQPFLIQIIPDKYTIYLMPGRNIHVATVELAVYFVQLLALICCLFFIGIKKLKTVIEKNNILIWMFLYETIAYLLSTQLLIFTRGAFLFSPLTIVLIPNLIKEIDNKKYRNIATGLIVVYGISVYIARILVNNIGTTMPYQFFWNAG